MFNTRITRFDRLEEERKIVISERYAYLVFRVRVLASMDSYVNRVRYGVTTCED